MTAPRCTCEQFGNGVVSGDADPPAPPGRLHNPECPVHRVVDLMQALQDSLKRAKAARVEGDSQ